MKYIDFAYPTSEHAREYGFYKEGCYLLKTAKENYSDERIVGVYAKYDHARDAGKMLPDEWSPMSK